jgi:hypothetical protein
MFPKEIEPNVNMIYLAQDMMQWGAPVNTLMNLKSREISLLAQQLLASQEEICSICSVVFGMPFTTISSSF